MSYIWILELFLLLLVVTQISMRFVAETTFKPTTVLRKGKKPVNTVAPELSTPFIVQFVPPDDFKTTTVLSKGKKPIKATTATPDFEPAIPFTGFVTTAPPDREPAIPFTGFVTTAPPSIEPMIPFTGPVTTAVPTTRSTAPPSIEPMIPSTGSPVTTAVPTTRSTAPPSTEPMIPSTGSPVTTAVPTTRSTAPPSTEPMIPSTGSPVTTAVPTTRSTAPPSTEPMIPSTGSPVTTAVPTTRSTAPPSTEPMIPSTGLVTTAVPTTRSTAPPSTEPMIPSTGSPVTTAVPTTRSTAPPSTEPMIPSTGSPVTTAGSTAFSTSPPLTTSSNAKPTTTLSNPISVHSSESSIAIFNSMALNTSTTAIISSSTQTTSTKALGPQHHHLGAILETVLSDYNPQLRPRNNQFRFVAIFSDFVPVNIIEFNTQEQKFSVMGYFKLDWRDDFLTWKKSMYEDMKNIRIPTRSIWIPKLSIDKAYDGNGLVGDMSSDIALINYRGYVRWFPEGTYSVVCTVTIRFYPFDTQTCTMTYYIADEDNSTINLKHDGEADLSEYIENAEWKLLNLTVERKLVDNVYVVNFHFNVERRGGFAMFTLVVPILLLAMLSGATFLIPIESGEKCSFSVTIFLAYGIFETVVIDTLPPNSLDISYFIIYLTSLLAISVLLTFYTILQAKISEAIGDKVFKCLSSSNSGSLTWGVLLQKLDTYVFAVFLVLVVGITSIFMAVMLEKFDVM